LCFTAQEANATIAMTIMGSPAGTNFETSFDGTTWTAFIPGTTTITLINIGDYVYFRGNNPNGLTTDSRNYIRFVLTNGRIAASGNIMSLIDNGSCTCTTIPNSGCFDHLFYNCTALTTAPKLPATTLTRYCYNSMFQGCTALTTAPALPAELADTASY